jgi:hypothetical protein
VSGTLEAPEEDPFEYICIYIVCVCLCVRVRVRVCTGDRDIGGASGGSV